ncbi:M20/M25/M40 family metallo-hydrolase [Candidatus Methylacidithermus pantelleriae]|uniref:M20_dimer domain-containing protein n=1 Tax=Candidatus Methylacidithermus pantelleriae TaxID=2744239 RepID=A0A8J2BHK0_9BACT|nr:M20/M25/M40 family metallo-hydrolase [Candidatus Methylacidithermus pantelleriae]CAF0695015.1 M20_dimer domain-containing protein [Candidatus Methylacidithermus pantelleriae]
MDWATLEQQALEVLQAYVRIPSVNPPADTSQTAFFLAELLRREGLEPRLFPSGPNGQTNLLVRVPGEDPHKRPLLLLNHMDVVPADEKAWEKPPFGAIVEDGFLWGRGALDMKGLAIQQLMALVALRRGGRKPHRDVLFLSTADEESGGKYGIRWMLEHHFSDLEPEYALDEGGFGTRDLFQSQSLVFAVQVADKQPLWVRLRAQGPPGHGSIPIDQAAPATLVRALAKILPWEEQPSPPPVVKAMIQTVGAALVDSPFTRAIQRNTLSLTSLQAGVGSPPKINVIPSWAEATLDCRLLPGTHPSDFLHKLEQAIGDPDIFLEVVSDAPDPTPPSSWETPLFEAIRRVVGRHYPGATVTPFLSSGFTDARYLRQRNVVAYGFMPMVLDNQTAYSAHSDWERIPVDEFCKGIHVFFDLLQEPF